MMGFVGAIAPVLVLVMVPVLGASQPAVFFPLERNNGLGRLCLLERQQLHPPVAIFPIQSSLVSPIPRHQGHAPAKGRP